jgi:3-oxoacyl-[acyl-carrier protein] reductase
MDLGLRNKRALVTAASRGLGLATARALGAEGARLAMTARSADSLAHEAAAIARSGKTETLPLTMDLRDPSSIARGVEQVLERWGGIDILIANTPGPEAGPFVSIDRRTWQEALDMTLMPVIDLMQRVIPSMRAHGGGRILCITTVGVKTAQPSMVLSNATRLAITGVAKTASVELAGDNILVNTLCPGPIDTDRMVNLIEATQKEKGMSREDAEAVWLDEVPLRRMGRAEDFGKLAAILVSDAASYVTGAALAVDGGKSRAY